MVKYALIRDDDINFFTSPEMLDKIYQEVFAMGIPTNLSVVPYVKTNIEIKNNAYTKFDGLKYEPFIPREYQDQNLHFAIHENCELIEFLHGAKEFLEIIQHGFSHSPNEFSSLNVNEMKMKIIEGRKILTQAFNETPKFFSAAYDGYSPISLSLLKRYFLGATYGEFTLRNMLSPLYITRLPLSMIPFYLNAMKKGETFFLSGDFLMLGHKDISINPFEDINKIKNNFKKCLEDQKIIIIAQHYWEYFYVRNRGCVKDKINNKLLDTFLEMIQTLKGKRVKFLTFSQLYKKIT